MKKILLVNLLACSVSVVYAQQKNLSSSKILQPTNTTMQPAKNTMGNQQIQNQQKIIPVPRKIMLFSKSPQLTLKSEKWLSSGMMNVMDYNTTRNTNISSTNINQQKGMKVNTNNSSGASQYVAGNDEMARLKAGVLAVGSATFNDKRKVVYSLNISNGPAQGLAAKRNPKKVKPDSSNTYWKCSPTLETVSAQSSTFMNASKNENGIHLYPGAIYTFDDYSKGTFRQPFEMGRNPVDLITDATGRGYNNAPITVSFPVQSPNSSSLHQAISNIIAQFAPNGRASVIQQTIYSENYADFSIAVSGGGSYDGFSASDNYSQSQTEHHIYITLDAIKPLFTISVNRPASGFFANGQMPQTSSPLVMVQNVTYGARMLVNLDISVTTNTDFNKFRFDYNDYVEASAYLQTDALNHDSTVSYVINSYMVGVPSSAGIIKTTEDFQDQVNNIFSQANYLNAAPIQYTLVDMDGNQLSIESMTDQFTVPNCTPASETYTLKRAFITLQTGPDGKNDNSQFVLTLGLGNSNAKTSTPGVTLNSIGTFKDETTEYRSGSTLQQQPITFYNDGNHPNGYTMDDFKDGGYVDFYLHCANNLFQSDDWDISNAAITFDLVSQKGNLQRKTFTIKNNFRLSSSTNGFKDGEQIFYFGNDFGPIQQTSNQ